MVSSLHAQVCREPKPEEENKTWYQSQVVNLKRMDEKMGAYIQAKGYALYEQKQSYGKSKKWKVTSSLKTGSTLAVIEGKGDHTDAANESINFNCHYYNATLLSVCQCTLVKELVTHSLTNIGTLRC
jgi:hypothetical protein